MNCRGVKLHSVGVEIHSEGLSVGVKLHHFGASYTVEYRVIAGELYTTVNLFNLSCQIMLFSNTGCCNILLSCYQKQTSE